MDEDAVFDGELLADGTLTVAESEDVRRMLAPMLFAYPAKPVGPGDTWEVKAGKGGSETTYSQSVAGIEKVKDVDALKITSKLKESGSSGLEADGTWWVGKDGKAIKFQLYVKNWYVVMADQSFDATITGELAP
jgi:hypothetical protein